jgi:recombination protein RecA
VVKNKIAPPFRNAEFNILNDRGIDFEGEVLAMGVEDELIEKSGAFYSYKGERFAQGEKKAIEYLRDNPAIRDEIANAIRAKRTPKLVDPASLEAAAAREEEEAAAELAALGEEVELPKKKRSKATAD